MTSLERSACEFVYHLAKEMDAKQGKPPTRETQRDVAFDVKKRFFDKP
jgi:hypothetical protein